MTRVMFAAMSFVAALSGCASPARYVETQSDTGVIAIPANNDVWPSYNRRAALALIEKHVGPNYEIVEEREIATGQRTINNQQAQNNQILNPGQPALKTNIQTAQHTTQTQDITEWRIAYRKRAGAPAGPATGAPSLPGSGSVQQTRYLSGGSQGVQHAGGVMTPGAGVVPAAGPGPLR